ncbi:MAG: DUF4070 domain-containing protein [Candidatus Woesearchaeota archaeon]
MKVLLVYPKCPDTFWSFGHALGFIKKKASSPPLGLLTVASMLPKRWEKKLLDMNVSELTDQQLSWPDMVLISAMIVQTESVKEIIKRCKALGKTIVAGGPCFTTTYMRFKDVDHFVLNEAEVTLPRFLNDLEKGTPKKVYSSKVRPDIRKTPVPMWSLISLKDYASMPIQYSRGCPFDCEFCDIVVMNGRSPRTKDPDQVIREFQQIFDYGWRGRVFIVDDNFIGNKEKVKRLLPLLIDWQKSRKYPFTLSAEASINLADDLELMQLMSRANFGTVFLGIETPSAKSLRECGKLNNLRNLSESVKIIHQNGLQVAAGFIVGFDNDPSNIFKTQIKFIQEIGVVTAMVGLLNVLPQTRLWHRLKAEGRLLHAATGENTDGTINFVPKMKEAKLIQGYKEIISTIYTPKNYYQRINTFIKHYKPTVRSRFTKRDLHALFKSFWKIGILSNSRFLYWRLLTRTFFTKIKAVPVAIELAIYGLHFEKFAQRTMNC